MAANAFTAFASGAVSAFGDIFRSAINIERVGAQFRVLIGDAEQAEIALRSVSEFAAGTPFDNPSVERAATQLLAFGTTAGQLNERLTDLGNIAGVANRSIDEIATIFGQVNAQGRLTAERFNQLVEGGINLGDALANRLMIPVTQLRDAISSGAVSADVFNEAIGELGDRFNGIDALAQTLGGQLSTLGSNFELLRRNIGSELTPALTEAVRALNSFLTSIQPVVQAIAQLVIGRALTFFRELVQGFNDGTSALARLRDFLVEHRGIIIRLVTAYALYSGTLVAVRLVTIAYGVAIGLISPLLTILRGAVIATRLAVVGLGVAFRLVAAFLTTTFTAVLAVLLTPIGAIGAAIVALGVIGTGFSDELALAFVRAQRAGTQLARAFTTVGIVIESTFREVGGSILRLIGPPIEFLLMGITRLIRAVPSAFRPAALDRFAESLDGISFTMLARNLETGESGLFAFNQELGRSDMRLAALETQLEMTANNTTFGEQLSQSFNDSLNSLQMAAANNEFLSPIISQISSFRMSLSTIGEGEGISNFVSGGRELLDSLRMALVDGEIPAALQNLVGGSVEEVQNAIRNIQDERDRADRNAAENMVTNNEMTNTMMAAQTAKEIAALQRKNEMIANIRLMAMEQLELLEVEGNIRAVEQDGIRDQAELNRLEALEQQKIDITARFSLLRANTMGDAGARAVAVEQTQANQSVAIARRAAMARMRLQEQELRSRMGYQNALNMLLSSALTIEGLGQNERKGIAIAQATINAYAGASRAFVDYPYPASLAVAASTVASGLIQVHNITSTGNFQQGGIIPGNSFSGDRLTANVNSGELILNRAQQDRIGSQLMRSEDLSVDMDARLASIESLLSRPTIITNADGRAFAEFVRDGVRDGVDING